MKLTTIIISGICFSAFILFICSYILDLNTNYSTNIDTTDLNGVSSLIQYSNNINQLQSNVENITQNPNWIDKIGGLMGASYNSIKLLFNPVTLTNDAVTNVGRQSGIDKNIITSINIIVILIALGILLSVIMKWDI